MSCLTKKVCSDPSSFVIVLFDSLSFFSQIRLLLLLQREATPDFCQLHLNAKHREIKPIAHCKQWLSKLCTSTFVAVKGRQEKSYNNLISIGTFTWIQTLSHPMHAFTALCCIFKELTLVVVSKVTSILVTGMWQLGKNELKIIELLFKVSSSAYLMWVCVLVQTCVLTCFCLLHANAEAKTIENLVVPRPVG